MLALLIISGLAGTVKNYSLNKKERKYATECMKSSKQRLFESLMGLTQDQLTYKPSKEKQSVLEYINHLTNSERKIWGLLESSMKSTANPEERAKITMTDEQVILLVSEGHIDELFANKPEKTDFSKNPIEKTLKEFNHIRNIHINYIKSTTEDLRNHVVETPLGWLDCYQVYLFISSYTDYLLKEVDILKSNPSFPQ